MTLLKDNNYKDINVALLSLEADIKNKITGGFDTSAIDKQLAEINSRIDKINTGGSSSSSEEIEDINSKLNSNSIKIRNIEQNVEDIGTQITGIEQKLSDIFSAENKVTDFNATTNSGIYYWVIDAANRPTDYGVLLVNKYDGGDSASNLWVNQIAYGTNNKIYFRQNINSTGWTGWKAVAFEGSLNANLTVNGKTYNGSEAVDAGVQTVANGGTGVTTQADINKAFVGNLVVGTSDVTDGTEFVSSYASDNGFNELGYVNTPFRRKFSAVWNYIKGKISSVLGLTKDNYGGKASTAGNADRAVTAGYADRLAAFAYWNNPFEWDSTNGIRIYVYKITMASWFNSILVQIYSDINYARCRRYVLGLWHASGYGYNVSVTDLGGTIDNGLKVWMGTDGNIYLQADVYWNSRISFSRLDDITDVTITKIGEARYGSNADINGNVLFTPLADPIIDCGAIRADDRLSAASKVPQILKTDVLRASSKMVIPIGAPSSPQDGDIWIER